MEEMGRPGKKRRKGKNKGPSLSSFSITQITEMRQKGETLGMLLYPTRDTFIFYDGGEIILSKRVTDPHQSQSGRR